MLPMSIEEIKRLAEAKPFQPFKIRVDDSGEAIQIPHPEYISVGPSGRRVIVVWHPDGTGSFLDPRLITRLDLAIA